MKKIILLVVVVGFVALYLNLGSAAKYVMEKAGSVALKTDVKIKKVDISLADQSVTVTGIQVKNLEGFKDENLLVIEKINVVASDLTGDAILMDVIEIAGLHIFYEATEKGSNIDALKKSLKSSKASEASENSTETEKSSKKVAIEMLKITDAAVTASIMGKEKNVTLPTIKLTNIGTKDNPTLPERAIQEVLNMVLKSTTGALAKDQIKGELDKVTGDIKSKASEKLKGLFAK